MCVLGGGEGGREVYTELTALRWCSLSARCVCVCVGEGGVREVYTELTALRWWSLSARCVCVCVGGGGGGEGGRYTQNSQL